MKSLSPKTPSNAPSNLETDSRSRSHFFPQGLPKRSAKNSLTLESSNKNKPHSKNPHSLAENFHESPFSWFWGCGRLMQSVWSELQLASKHDIHSLLIGETGSGKEVIAREIHRLRCARLRKDAETTPFVAINCAAIPEGLAESMLFGHERGAFTSAREKQAGRFEQAQGGTLFLDEIQNLSFPIQAKILRVLQTGEVERLGAQKSIKVDCKIVAASNIPLDLLVQKGLFRKDLYYRLSIAPILIPPLRSRTEDLSILVRKLCSELCKRYQFEDIEISSEYLKKLEAHSWPGNLRELEHALLYSLLKANGNKNRLELSEVPSSINGSAQAFVDDGKWDISPMMQAKTQTEATQPA